MYIQIKCGVVMRRLKDGKPELVQAASVSIHGCHGQHIENIHLEQYLSEDDFWEKLYKNKYSKLFEKARAFARGTPQEEVLIFIRYRLITFISFH